MKVKWEQLRYIWPTVETRQQGDQIVFEVFIVYNFLVSVVAVA